MRQKLLGNKSDSEDGLQPGEDDDDVGLDVKFGVGFNEDIGRKLVHEKDEKIKVEGMTDWEKYQEKKAKRKREKKEQAKLKKEEKKKQGRMTAKEAEE